MSNAKKILNRLKRRTAATLKKINKHLERRRIEANFLSGSEFSLVSYYDKAPNCELARLCDVYGSDKGSLSQGQHPYPWSPHTYTDYYSQIFSLGRQNVKKIFECGIGTNNPNLPSSMGAMGKPGASLRVWRDYFPNAIVYGADIDRDILFNEDRIKTYHIDQLSEASIANYWKEAGVSDLDIMVDDGLHSFEAGVNLFVHSIEKLSQDGVYIIEDVSLTNLMRFRDFFRKLNYDVQFLTPRQNRRQLLSETNLVVVKKRR